MADPRTQIFSASIPTWLRERLDQDIRELGNGPQRHGGSQGIAMIALSMYLALPPDERTELATAGLPATVGEEVGAPRLERLWPVRAVAALAAMDARARERRIKGLEAGARARGGARAGHARM